MFEKSNIWVHIMAIRVVEFSNGGKILERFLDVFCSDSFIFEPKVEKI